eukprot:9965153-Heterocapsa_arctica.AAC.1
MLPASRLDFLLWINEKLNLELTLLSIFSSIGSGKLKEGSTLTRRSSGNSSTFKQDMSED